MSIFGIPDRSRELTWKFALALAVAVPLLFAFNNKVDQRIRVGILLVLTGLVAAGITGLIGHVLVRRFHPGFRIARLLQAKRIEEARSLADKLVVKHPDDPLVLLNGVAAFYTAGDAKKAREILETVNPSRLPKVLADCYSTWQVTLKSV